MLTNDSNISSINREKMEDSGIYDVNSSCDFSTSLNSSKSRYREPDNIRLRINSRERQRMHELNDALDALRGVLPNSHGSSLKKLSKLSTLVHAREHILSLSRSIEEMKLLVQSLSKRQTRDSFFDTAERSLVKCLNHPSAFVPNGSRYAPYTSTPIKSMERRQFRTPFLEIPSPNLKFKESRLNEEEMDVSYKENVNDSFSTGSTTFLSLSLGNRSDSHYQTAPLDTSRRHLPEFMTPSKDHNSSPTKPVLKFSVASLLGLSNKPEIPANDS